MGRHVLRLLGVVANIFEYDTRYVSLMYGSIGEVSRSGGHGEVCFG